MIFMMKDYHQKSSFLTYPLVLVYSVWNSNNSYLFQTHAETCKQLVKTNKTKRLMTEYLSFSEDKSENKKEYEK